MKMNEDIEVLDCVASTNDYLKGLASERVLRHGYTVIAKRQTKGRGRRGRSFLSPEGGLYMSILLRPEISADKLSLVTPAAAAAVVGAIKAELPELDPKIKWVNDIKLNGKKVCGILTEAVTGADGGICCVICGIGINVYLPEGGFAPEIERIAGYLTCEYRENLIDALSRRIISSLTGMTADGSALERAAEYYRGSVMTGMRVRMPSGIEGTAESVDENCRMLVRCDDGRLISVGEGELVEVQ